MDNWKETGNKECSENMESKRQDYNQANGAAKRAIYKATDYERKRFCDDMRIEEKGIPGIVFRFCV